MGKWINQQAFYAQLYESQPGGKARGFSLWGVWMLRAGLENPLDSESTALRECHYRAAAVWVLQAGDALYHQAKTGQGNEAVTDQMTKPGPLYEGKGPGRLNPTRWAFWKQRFEYLRDNERAKDVAAVGEGDGIRRESSLLVLLEKVVAKMDQVEA